MIFTEEWLRQYVNPALGTDELADALTMAGLEVEEVRTIAPAFSGVVVGEVLSCRDHENSDHLHVCEVNAGTGETLQIVCGAPNVRAGIKVACATIGAVLPGDFRIKKSKLRGVVSMGMLCSTRELGINEDHNGIWILPDDAPVGVDIRQYARLDDAKIELKLTPNRSPWSASHAMCMRLPVRRSRCRRWIRLLPLAPARFRWMFRRPTFAAALRAEFFAA